MIIPICETGYECCASLTICMKPTRDGYWPGDQHHICQDIDDVKGDPEGALKYSLTLRLLDLLPVGNSRYSNKHCLFNSMCLGHCIEMQRLAESQRPMSRKLLLERRLCFGGFRSVSDVEERTRSTAGSEE